LNNPIEETEPEEPTREPTRAPPREPPVEQNEDDYSNEPPQRYTPKQLNEAQQQVDYYNEGRLPPLANSSTEVMQDIYTPDRDIDNRFDYLHALKDFTLTYTKTDEERNFLMIGGYAETACDYNGLYNVAKALLSEDKRFMGLLRSHNFAQQRELRSTRQFVEGREKKEQDKGLFSFMSKKQEE
jgi:hypothetical protein